MSNDQGASEAAIRYRDLAWIELPLRRFSRRVQGKFVFVSHNVYFDACVGFSHNSGLSFARFDDG